MQALHFGAGNIGRGFIGQLLYEGSYHTTLIDVNDAVIQALNEKQAYNVILADEKHETLTVKNVTGINNMSHPEDVVEVMKTADLITTAVGPNVLPIISDLIAKGLQARNKETDRPLNIIACENMIGGSSLLKEKVFAHLKEDEKETFEGYMVSLIPQLTGLCRTRKMRTRIFLKYRWNLIMSGLWKINILKATNPMFPESIMFMI